MSDKIYDVIVIGGGPAGMMSAGRAGELGAKVILLEKNATLGKKLLITGGGRCNVTNAEFDNRKLAEKFKADGKFLLSPLSKWSVKETLSFFHQRKMETKVENENRVFPLSNKAQSVWEVMVNYIKENNVLVMVNSPVAEILRENTQVTGVKLKNGKIINGRSVIVATGGTSHPETGSTGDAFAWLGKLGHKIIETIPSLVPLVAKDSWIKGLAGVTLSNIKLTPYLDGIKQVTSKKIRGSQTKPSQKILFTHVGISGPCVLNMSKEIGELLRYGEVVISLDLLPEYDYSRLNTALQNLFMKNAKKLLKNCLDEIIPSAMVPVVIEMSEIDSDVNCNGISRESRLKLITLLKGIPIHIDKLLGNDKAIVSSGGVALEEIDWQTMASKLYPNLFLIGDTLNIDRPSGGFSLQLCWTTGFVAGCSVASTIHSEPVEARSDLAGTKLDNFE
jgi:predicted Rossmann fold flavoprotein